MNKIGQFDPKIILVILLGILLISILPSIFNSIGCQNEKNQIKDLQQNLNYCRDSIANTQRSLEGCLSEFNQSKLDCEKNNQNLFKYSIFSIDLSYNYAEVEFIIYSLILIVPISLTFSLFKVVINIKSKFGDVFLWVLLGLFFLLLIWMIIVGIQ